MKKEDIILENLDKEISEVLEKYGVMAANMTFVFKIPETDRLCFAGFNFGKKESMDILVNTVAENYILTKKGNGVIH